MRMTTHPLLTSISLTRAMIATHRLALYGYGVLYSLSDIVGVGPSGCSTHLYVKLPSSISGRFPAFGCVLLHHVFQLAYMFAQWFWLPLATVPFWTAAGAQCRCPRHFDLPPMPSYPHTSRPLSHQHPRSRGVDSNECYGSRVSVAVARFTGTRTLGGYLIGSQVGILTVLPILRALNSAAPSTTWPQWLVPLLVSVIGVGSTGFVCSALFQWVRAAQPIVASNEKYVIGGTGYMSP